jgi:hypothetical protein
MSEVSSAPVRVISARTGTWCGVRQVGLGVVRRQGAGGHLRRTGVRMPARRPTCACARTKLLGADDYTLRRRPQLVNEIVKVYGQVQSAVVFKCSLSDPYNAYHPVGWADAAASADPRPTSATPGC